VLGLQIREEDVEVAAAGPAVVPSGGVALGGDGNALAVEALSGSCEVLILEHLDGETVVGVALVH
jgi:hypothetical protein